MLDMQTLDSPMYEVNQECDFYKLEKSIMDQQGRVREILREIEAEIGCEKNELSIYSAGRFGFKPYDKSFKKFEDQLKKHGDRNGIHTFKVKSKVFLAISPKIKEIDSINKKQSPFALHDIFGFNNLKASQWIGDRLFVGVKDADVTEKVMNSETRRKQYPVEPVKAIDYKEYLQLVMNNMEEKEQSL